MSLVQQLRFLENELLVLVIKFAMACKHIYIIYLFFWPGVVLLGILGGGVPPSSQNPDPISDQKCNFPHPFSDQTSKIHTRFQIWPLGRNYVIITQIRAQTKIFFFKFISNLNISRSFLLIINTFIHSLVPSKIIPNSRPKWVKCVPVFRPKRRKNPTRWGGADLYNLYKVVSPGGGFQEAPHPTTHIKTKDKLEILEMRNFTFQKLTYLSYMF